MSYAAFYSFSQKEDFVVLLEETDRGVRVLDASPPRSYEDGTPDHVPRFRCGLTHSPFWR